MRVKRLRFQNLRKFLVSLNKKMKIKRADKNTSLPNIEH